MKTIYKFLTETRKPTALLMVATFVIAFILVADKKKEQEEQRNRKSLIAVRV